MKQVKYLMIAVSLVFLTTACTQKNLEIEFEKYTLANGLEVVLHEDHSDPVVAVAVQYHVGSNREKKGRTGFAHLFEHMLFKASQHVPAGQFFNMVEEDGGTLNGYTTADETVYYEVVPKNALEKILWMESDRMGWLLPTVTAKAFENEKEIVKNEKRQRVDNRPYGQLWYLIAKTMFPDGHPYSWTTIGELADIQNATLEDIKQFYQQWYGPNNATLVIAGDIDKVQTKAWVEKYFGEIKRGPENNNPKVQLTQLNETKKYHYLDRFANAPLLNINFAGVDFKHQDVPALELLSLLLSSGKNSELYKLLVEKEKLLPSVTVFNRSLEMAGAFHVFLKPYPGVDLNQLESAFFQAIQNFEEKGFSEQDLNRVKAFFETNFYNKVASVQGKATELAYYNENFDDPNYLNEELEHILAVKAADIWKVFNTYIKDQNFVSIAILPYQSKHLALKGSQPFVIEEEGIEKNISKKEAAADAVASAPLPSTFDRSVMPLNTAEPSLLIPNIWSHEYSNKVQLLGVTHKELPLIELNISFDGGILAESKELSGLANLTAQLLREGTENKNSATFEKALDELGSSIQVSVSSENLDIYVQSLARNYAKTMALLQEMLYQPRWDEKEFERIKSSVIDDINMSASDPRYIARKAFKKIIFNNDGYARTQLGTVESVSKIQIEDVKAFYQKILGSQNTKITVTGDIKRSKAVASLKALVNSLPSKDIIFSRIQRPKVLAKPQLYFIDIPNAKQSQIYVGYPSLAYSHPDFYKAQVMNDKLGGSGSAKLFQVLREEKGYTYGAYSRFTGGSQGGYFLASTSVRSNATQDSVRLIQQILKQYHSQKIQEEDLAFTKNSLLKSNVRRFETLGSINGMLANIAKYDLPYDYLKERESFVKTIDIPTHHQLAKTYIQPQQAIYLVVGDAKTQLRALERLGLGKAILLNKEGDVL